MALICSAWSRRFIFSCFSSLSTVYRLSMSLTWLQCIITSFVSASIIDCSQVKLIGSLPFCMIYPPFC